MSRRALRPLVGVWVYCVLLATLLAFPNQVRAQGEPRTTQADDDAQRQTKDRHLQAHPAEPDWFLESSYVAPMWGTKSAGADGGRPVVEIQSFHHVPMFPRQNSGRYQHWIEAGADARKRQRFALTLGTILRGHDGPSVPIQTPSVIFAGRYQYLQHRVVDDVSRILVAEGGVYHHSNGQDGCTFTEQSRINDECVPDATPALDSWVVNPKDGSFGVNYLSAKVGVSRRRLDAQDPTIGSREVRVAQNLQVEFRRYVTFIPGGSGIRQIERRFGRNEIDAQAQYELPSPWQPGQFRHIQLTLRGWRRFGADARGSGGTSAEISWLGFAGGVAGPFVRYYRGSDYYNIRFEEKRRQVMVGLKWERSRLARIPAPTTWRPPTSN